MLALCARKYGMEYKVTFEVLTGWCCIGEMSVGNWAGDFIVSCRSVGFAFVWLDLCLCSSYVQYGCCKMGKWHFRVFQNNLIIFHIYAIFLYHSFRRNHLVISSLWVSLYHPFQEYLVQTNNFGYGRIVHSVPHYNNTKRS